jgi:hypothetical protein
LPSQYGWDKLGNEEHKAGYNLANGPCDVCNYQDYFYLSGKTVEIMLKKIPESPEFAILPEQVTDILQFARACSLGIITPEELGNKLDDFETWLGEHF